MEIRLLWGTSSKGHQVAVACDQGDQVGNAGAPQGSPSGMEEGREPQAVCVITPGYNRYSALE